MSSGMVGIPKIPIYSGKVKKLEIDSWKRAIQHHFRFLSTYQKITITDADQVILVASLLTGRAAAWWDNQNRIHLDPVATYPTIDALTAAMKQYFEPPTQRLRQVREKYRNAKQRTTVGQYNDYFQDLRAQLEKDIPETQVIDDYLQGLNPKIMVKVEEENPTTLGQAMEIALRKERFTKIKGKEAGKKGTEPPKRTHEKGSPNVAELRPTQNTETAKPDLRRSDRLKDRTNERDMTKIQCFACDQYGHYASACPERKKGEAYAKMKESVLKRLAEEDVRKELKKQDFL